MLKKILFTLGLLLFLALAGAGGVLWAFWQYGRGLPDYHQLADYQPPVTTRIHAGDGRLLGEFASERRVFVAMSTIPRRVIDAFLSAEDKTFYSHPGIDLPSVVGAALINIKNMGQDRRPVGASTITQQVAKNFLLSSEVSYTRKIKEAILAFRIERAISKDRILELYLNEIYLGEGAYGVAAAALKYFDKSLDELTVAEVAFLAALPKAPSRYSPRKDPVAAKQRRDWVIGRMLEDGHITAEEAKAAVIEPLTVREPENEADAVKADYFIEEVRRQLLGRYGDAALYQGGLSVRGTLDPHLQDIARRALRNGLETYDRRHGWRGPLGHVEPGTDWKSTLAAAPRPKGLGPWPMALVLKVEDTSAEIGLPDGATGTIPLGELTWARPWLKEQKVGGPVRKAKDLLKPGDLVAVEAVTTDGDGKAYPSGFHGLRQLPAIDGAIVVMDPHTGRVLAMVGGYDYERSQFNRATQANRQPGSAFKPFVYLTALDTGTMINGAVVTPASLILDAPFVLEQGPGLPKWKPQNYGKEFYGPSTLRLGIEKSRNLMTVRLAQSVGMDKVSEYAARFGIVDNMPPTLSMALGAGETTLLRLANAYAMLVNGGRRVQPSLIDRIQDRDGRTVFRHDNRPCDFCVTTFWANQPVPEIPDTRDAVADAASTYQVVSMLKGVVERGTGQRIAAVGKPLAGKTGTTNGSLDTWFVGFAPDLVAGVFVGFDEPSTLGPKETGSSVAAPIFRDFMKEALADKSTLEFRIPPGIRLVRVNATTGALAQPSDKNVILEAFKEGTEPTATDGPQEGHTIDFGEGTSIPAQGTGGLY